MFCVREYWPNSESSVDTISQMRSESETPAIAGLSNVKMPTTIAQAGLRLYYPQTPEDRFSRVYAHICNIRI